MRRTMRSIALLGLVVVRTTATRFLRGLAEHSPANVTNYTRCVFQRVNKVECHSTYSQELRFKDEAFSQCDADPKCDAVQKKWKERQYDADDKKKVEYKLCSLRKDACDRVRLDKYRNDCDEDDTWCTYNHVFTCLPYDEAPAMRSEGLFALCIIMIFACPFLIIIVAAVVAAAAAGCPTQPDPDGPDPEVSPVFTLLFCPFVVFWFLTFAFLSAYYGPAYNHSTDGACAPNPWGTHRTTIVKYGIIATVLSVCVPALPAAIQTCAQAVAAAISCCTGMAGCATTRPRERRMDLWQACSQGDVAAARLLLDKGAAVNRANEYGKTPLYIACEKGHVDAARLLLDKGAEVDRENNNGETPLYTACKNGRVDAARLLLDKGAKVDRATNWGVTPLWTACFNGHVDAARLLLEKDADVHKASKANRTPLHEASYRGHIDVVRLLLATGANADLKDKHGDTPVADAKSMDHSSIVALLEEHKRRRGGN